MYYASRGQAKAPKQLLVWELVEKFHWTFEYVESLPAEKIHEYLRMKDAKTKAGVK